MTNRIEISKVDVIPLQVIAWVMTGVSLLPLVVMLCLSFSWNTFYVFLWACLMNYGVQHWNRKMWNIWYDDGFLIFKNIYGQSTFNICSFEKVEMTSVFNNSYTLYLTPGKRYHFRIKPTHDLKLFFKTDSQFYAKALTEKLNNLKA